MWLTFILTALLATQTLAHAQALSPGVVGGNLYANSDLGIRYEIPAGWRAEPQADNGVLDVRFTPPRGDGSEIEMFVLDSSVYPRVTPLRIPRNSDQGAKYEFERMVPGTTIGTREFLRTDWIRKVGKQKLYHSRLATDAKGWRMILFVSAPKQKAVDQEIADLSSLQFDPKRPTDGPPGPVLQPADKENSGAKRLLKKVHPEYPKDAIRRGEQGSVLLEMVIGTDGKVKEVNPIAGAPVFMGPATDAVRQWEYRPYIVDGKPVEVYTITTVSFTIGH